MGKIRVATLGDEEQEKQQKKDAEARREAKKLKKQKTADSTSENQNDTKSDLADGSVAEGEETKKSKKQVKAKTHSKKYKEVIGLVDKNKLYSLLDAIALLKKTSMTKFDGTVDIHISLNTQLLGGKTEFRGQASLPHGTGKTVKVAIVSDEILKELENGVISFDILISHPSLMGKVAKFARVLGPKGLMPNPKNGTVSDDPEKRAKELAGGQINFKTEPNNPLLHVSVGKVSFSEEKLSENVVSLFSAIGKSKISRATLASTMSPGIKLDVAKI
jgi:large subunit ribosomal protein L1